ncbi:uncharacterized protein PAC_17988 [Phialocephala subalpina]|uniref:Uncharacterized protein n=1 Tax=Phialocephala subalpina TaxID=576137 RepID=A0A1L7XSW6_9HELO|nr:uncharacterized protein PAC_17988 [Phialocephala subalpina]
MSDLNSVTVPLHCREDEDFSSDRWTASAILMPPSKAKHEHSYWKSNFGGIASLCLESEGGYYCGNIVGMELELFGRPHQGACYEQWMTGQPRQSRRGSVPTRPASIHVYQGTDEGEWASIKADLRP